MRHSLLILVAGLLVAADAQDDAVKKDLDQLQGAWRLVAAERDGKKLPDEEVKKTKITFQGSKFLFPDAAGIGTSKMGVIKIDPSKKPKSMDSTATDEAGKGQTALGIYDIQGDDYKVCFSPPGKERPTEWTSKPGSGIIIQIWKREKK